MDQKASFCGRFDPSRRPDAPARGFWWTVLIGDEAGASIEFALLAPMFIAVLLAIMNTVLIYLAQEGLESASEQASRLLLTGQIQTFQSYNGATQNTGMTAAQFKSAICGTLSYSASANASTQTSFGGSLLPPFLDCSSLYVNVVPASSFTSSNTTPPTLSVDANGNIVGTSFSVQSGATTQNQVLVVQLLYLWPTVTGPLGMSMGNTPAGNRILTATEVINTEGYPCPPGTVGTC
ncbi:TadE/TadG family type IV pilus assembly protein [Novosphingobium sp.]|uniref:TadE/TadG family type IV pilus assembly protein n=1 Tax=Novosphingobium sp. TaxID=1874826 RepID=UPI003B51EF12